MTTDTQATKVAPYRHKHVLACIAILVAIAVVGLKMSETSPRKSWLFIMILLGAFAVIAGHAVTNLWRGILIDGRCKISLSRLQLLSWSLVILSAFLTVVLRNVGLKAPDPLDILIPSELWVLMGISATSMVASPALLSKKTEKVPEENQRDTAVAALTKVMNEGQADGATQVDVETDGLVVKNAKPEDARWADLFRGEEIGNATSIDVGKLQMFFFTFILILAYSAAIAAMLRGATGPLDALPLIPDGMNVLLGISHTGYLLNKTLPHSREAKPDSDPAGGGGK